MSFKMMGITAKVKMKMLGDSFAQIKMGSLLFLILNCRIQNSEITELNHYLCVYVDRLS